MSDEKSFSVFDLWIPVFCFGMALVSAVAFYEEYWLPAIIVLFIGLLFMAWSFRIVRPAFAGLIFRFGSRVVLADGEYLTRKEGWTFIFPILERIVEISLRQHQEEINAKKIGEAEDAYLDRAESFFTAQGINIFPEIFYSYKIVNPGMVFELGGGIDENGDSPFLAEILHDLVMGGTRGVLAEMELTMILSRKTKDENGLSIPIGEKIRGEIVKTPNYEKLGAEILILRIEDIKSKKDAQDVLDALEDIKKKEFKRQSDIIEADTRLQVQKKDSETVIVKAEAELQRAKKEALALNAEIAAFVGKKVDELTTAEEGRDFARYKIGLAVAKALETGTKVIIPAGDMNKTIAGLINVFDSSRE